MGNQIYNFADVLQSIVKTQPFYKKFPTKLWQANILIELLQLFAGQDIDDQKFLYENIAFNLSLLPIFYLITKNKTVNQMVSDVLFLLPGTAAIKLYSITNIVFLITIIFDLTKDPGKVDVTVGEEWWKFVLDPRRLPATCEYFGGIGRVPWSPANFINKGICKLRYLRVMKKIKRGEKLSEKDQAFLDHLAGKLSKKEIHQQKVIKKFKKTRDTAAKKRIPTQNQLRDRLESDLQVIRVIHAGTYIYLNDKLQTMKLVIPKDLHWDFTEIGWRFDRLFKTATVQ